MDQYELLGNQVADIYKKLYGIDNKNWLVAFKLSICEKIQLVNYLLEYLDNIHKGTITHDFYKQLVITKGKYKEFKNSIDDRLMIFIVGNGNVGKSTLINALIGENLAKVDYRPCTWKIDVYSNELEENALIKKRDGSIIQLSFSDAVELVDEEEKKCLLGKENYNREKNKMIKDAITKEEREEIKKKLSKDLCYISDITEVRWPIKNKKFTEKYVLVDTPGLVQNLYQYEQMGNIKNYYHLADGIIWVLDATAVMGENSKKCINSLEEEFNEVGGIRNNIIGVLNRKDLIENQDGNNGISSVVDRADKLFGEYFKTIIPISAKEAVNGNLITSGINKLEDKISQLFIDKAYLIRNNSKTSGVKLLDQQFTQLIDAYINKLEEKLCEKEMKLETITKQTEDFKREFFKKLTNLIEDYLIDVKILIDKYILDINGVNDTSRIISQMYKFDEFHTKIESFINTNIQELNVKANIWLKKAYISEYKYIENIFKNNTYKIKLKINFDIDFNIEEYLIFESDYNYTIKNKCKNIINKFGLFAQKRDIKAKIYSNIENKTSDIKKNLYNKIYCNCEEHINECKNQLDKSYKDFLLDYKDIKDVERICLQKCEQMNQDIKKNSIKEILL